jgi:hypothetical protein
MHDYIYKIKLPTLTLRLSGLITHKPTSLYKLGSPSYKTKLQFIIQLGHILGVLQSPPLIFALSSVQLSHSIHNISKIFKKMWVFCSHSIFMFPCCILRTVPGPLDLYESYGSIPELFFFPVQYAHRMHLQDTFLFHMNHIPIDYMISIRYIFIKK